MHQMYNVVEEFLYISVVKASTVGHEMQHKVLYCKVVTAKSCKEMLTAYISCFRARKKSLNQSTKVYNTDIVQLPHPQSPKSHTAHIQKLCSQKYIHLQQQLRLVSQYIFTTKHISCFNQRSVTLVAVITKQPLSQALVHEDPGNKANNTVATLVVIA